MRKAEGDSKVHWTTATDNKQPKRTKAKCGQATRKSYLWVLPENTTREVTCEKCLRS